MCVSLCVSGNKTPVKLLTINGNSLPTDRVLTYGFDTWLFAVLLIPVYQFVIHPLIRSHKPSMLKCIGIGLFLQLLGDVLLEAISVKSVLDSGDVQRYVSCKHFHIMHLILAVILTGTGNLFHVFFSVLEEQ